MNSQLAEIPWGSLRHAQGEASDLPALLRGLEEKKEGCLEEIEDLIFGDGRLYSATPPTIQYLIQFAGQDPRIALLIANCCRAKIWLGSGSTEAKLADDLIDIANSAAATLLNGLETANSDTAAACACILFYCTDREFIAEGILQHFDQGRQLDERAQAVLALAAHGAPGVHVGNEDDSFLGFAFRISQSTTGMYEEELDLLLADLRDISQVDQMMGHLASLDEALGTFGELLLASTKKIRALIVSPLIAIFNRTTKSGEAWKRCIALLHMDFDAPPKSSSGDLSPTQRLVLKAIENHDPVWELDRLSADISDVIEHEIASRDELKSFLGPTAPVVAMIMTPNESPLVMATLDRFDRQEWENIPWLLFKGDTSKLEWQIAEDRAYFTADVMSQAYQVAAAMMSNIAYEIDPFIDSFRFYPNLSAEKLGLICKENGWVVHNAPEWAGSLSAISYSDAFAQPVHLDRGLKWTSIPKEIRKEIEVCATYLSGALWEEALEWNDYVKKSKRPVTPLMFAKYRDIYELTVSYWPYDRTKARLNGKHVGERYLLVAIEGLKEGAKEKNLIRIYFDNNLQLALRILRKHQDMLAETPDALQKFLQELVLKLEKVSLEFENGVIQDLSLQKYDA